jgi:integrase
MANIIKVSDRAALKPRHEPYWLRLSSGAYLGYRKLTKDSLGSWVAYWRDADTGKKQKHSLGEYEALAASERFDQAKKDAEAWLATRGLTLRIGVETVADACRDYVKHLRDEKRGATADDAEARFKRFVYPKKDLADCDLGKLTAHRLELWRKGLQKTAVKVSRTTKKDAKVVTRPRSASSVNRDVNTLRAALNRAHRLGCVASDVAWLEALKPTKNADGRRDVYLSRDQRRALIGHAAKDIAVYVKGLSLLPLRPGALADLKVKHFDARLGVLTIGKDKSGADRRVKLPAETAKFFGTLVVDKLPEAPLFARADGSAWDRFAWRDAIRDAVAAAGLPPATSAYALRHSTITDLATGGLDLMTVAQISGTSVAMIEKHYAHLQSDRAAAALAGLAL